VVKSAAPMVHALCHPLWLLLLLLLLFLLLLFLLQIACATVHMVLLDKWAGKKRRQSINTGRGRRRQHARCSRAGCGVLFGHLANSRVHHLPFLACHHAGEGSNGYPVLGCVDGVSCSPAAGHARGPGREAMAIRPRERWPAGLGGPMGSGKVECKSVWCCVVACGVV